MLNVQSVIHITHCEAYTLIETLKKRRLRSDATSAKTVFGVISVCEESSIYR